MSSDKNEMLFTDFGVNYNDLPQLHRKGTVIIWGSAQGEQVRVWRAEGVLCWVRMEKVLVMVCSYAGGPADVSYYTSYPICTQLDCNSSLVQPPHTLSGAEDAPPITSGTEGVPRVTLMGLHKGGSRKILVQLHEDIISDSFWRDHPRILDENSQL